MKYSTWIIVGSLLFAFVVRVIIPWQSIFTVSGVLLNTPDAYIMLHYADLWPNFPAWDWYTNFPAGIPTPHYEVFASLIAILGRLFKMSNTLVGAFLPVVLFYLTLIPVYFTARALFDKRIALGSVVVFCLLPGEILERTRLGAADYHCWEILLLALIMMFAVLALKNRPMYWIGVLEVLVIYWVSWQGALLAPFVIVSGILLFAFLSLKAWPLKALVVFCYTGMGIACYFVNPVLFKTGVSLFTWELEQTNLESMPLFFSQGQFNIDTMWAYFGPVFFFALFGLGWFLYRTIKYKRPEDCLFLAWSGIGMFLMFAMRRFEYYWALNASLLAMFACIEYLSPYLENKEKLATNLVALILLVCVIPAGISVQASLRSQFTMSADWQDTCQWLRKQGNDSIYYAGAKPEYGVFTWWNYGYWIITEGHQAILGSPGFADGHRASKILMSPDSLAQLKELKMRYVIIDKDMIASNLYSITVDAGITDLGNSFAYKLYSDQSINGIKKVRQFGSVKIFEIK